jgi:hypothetical protein
MKYCADPCCGKEMKQRDDEKDGNFRTRRYCNKRCAAVHFAEKNKPAKRMQKYPSQEAVC